MKPERIHYEKTQKIIAGVATLMASAAIAYTNTGIVIPAQASEIAKQLEAEGWSIVEVEVEDGEVEIEAEKGDMEREVVVSLDTGEVLEDETEQDDD